MSDSPHFYEDLVGWVGVSGQRISIHFAMSRNWKLKFPAGF